MAERGEGAAGIGVPVSGGGEGEMCEAIDGRHLVRWGQACIDGLTVSCDEINRLNVFPVADSDTGTNLLFTMRSAMDAVARRTSGHASAGAVAAAMATGATSGARGNSGIILSQVLRGLAAAARHGPLTTSSLREALDTAASLVRTAVSDPVEGTIVTVLDCAALAARGCPAGATLEEIAFAAAEAAGTALERTTKQLAVLEDAGVVDAGGRGLLVLLDSLVTVVGGHAPVRRRFEGARLQGEVGFELGTRRHRGPRIRGDVSHRRHRRGPGGRAARGAGRDR